MKPNIQICYSRPLAFFHLAVVIIFYGAIIYEINQDGPNNFLIGLLGLLSIYSLYLVIKTIVPAINGSVMIEIGPDGIVDNLNNRTLYWKQIDSMNYRVGGRTSSGVVILNVENPRNYYSSSLFGTLKYWSNKIYDGYPIVIKTRSLNVDTKELFDKISEYYDAEIKAVK